METLKPMFEAAINLRQFTARAGMFLLTFILYADVFAFAAGMSPLLDAVTAAPRDGRTLVLALLSLSLFPVLMAEAPRAARIAYYSMLVMLGELAKLLPWLHIVPSAIEHVFGTEWDRGWSSRRFGRSERLLAKALSGVASAFDLYKQRNRAMLDDLELADESLALLIILVVNRRMVTPDGILARAWRHVPAGNASVIVGVLVLAIMWMLACQGLRPGQLPNLERDLDAVLHSEEDPPKNAPRPGD